MWDAVKALPAAQSSRVLLRRLRMLLHVLVRLAPSDMRVTKFHINCKVSMIWHSAVVSDCLLHIEKSSGWHGQRHLFVFSTRMLSSRQALVPGLPCLSAH
jgi:hypothetical protein